MTDLTELETEVREAARNGRTPEANECLGRVELKIDALRRQCRKCSHHNQSLTF